MGGIYGVPEPVEPIPQMTFVEARTEQLPLPLPELSETAAQPVSTRHGRPSGAVIKERDHHVFDVVSRNEGVRRTEVAEQTGLTMYEAYLSLNRLKNQHRVRILREGSTHLWVAAQSVDFPVIPGQTRISD